MYALVSLPKQNVFPYSEEAKKKSFLIKSWYVTHNDY